MCEECGAEPSPITGNTWHDQFCTRQSLKQLRGTLARFKHNENASKIVTKRLREQVTFWQGKFNMVRNENNKLRKNDKRTKSTTI